LERGFEIERNRIERNKDNDFDGVMVEQGYGKWERESLLYHSGAMGVVYDRPTHD